MHPLELVLQLQVGSDQTAVLSLPSIISSLTPPYFEPSPHLQKWISRVTSLIHSKHPGARWAGLCLALQTSVLNKEIMLEASQGWIAITLPMLSRNEAPPTWKACIRLLEFLFSSATSIPEFQRQLAMPNIPKFSAALLSLGEKSEDREIRHVCMMALTRLVPLYPTLHRQLHTSLFNLSFRILSGSYTSPTLPETISDACCLHAVLHFTGGKVGAAPLWRKSLDTALANAWSSFSALRTTFLQRILSVSPTFDFLPSDPALVIPLSLDRLKCSIALIGQLLEAVISRPVPVPVGELVQIALCLLKCIPDEKVEVHFDSTRRALEISIIPEIWKLGCFYVSQLVKSLRHHLNPHLAQIVSYVTYHLEQSIPKCVLPLQLAKSLIPILTTLLPGKSEVQPQLQDASATSSKKGKKRARGYEGDEVFKVGIGVLCPTIEDSEIIEIALEALDPLLSNPHLSAPIRTLALRLLVTLLLEIPRYSPSAHSRDLAFHGRVHAKVLLLCSKHVLVGSSGWVNSALGLVINGTEGAMYDSELTQRQLDTLLHPRLPPLLRSQPPVEAVYLFRSGSAKDDKAARDAVGLNTIEDIRPAQETTTLEGTTVQQIHRQAAITSALQSSSAATVVPGPAPPPSMPALISSFVAPSLSAITEVQRTERSTPNIQNDAIIDQTPRTAKSGAPVTAQQSISSALTYSGALGLSRDEDSDLEEMPEIDTRSDSD
ncbi:rRNA processing/ribosome biogenesis-domain-containing protein [Gautieria morchelliformis]|nr:rRNA processing/ribosome biogenesis-domain-containing protein [Gautieria morchelliformis]